MTSGVASKEAGAALVGSFLLAAFAAFLSALCYTEYAARFPGTTAFSLLINFFSPFFLVSGSAYTFTYLAMGEAMAWMYVTSPPSPRSSQIFLETNFMFF